jgi:group I intron endonuclease
MDYTGKPVIYKIINLHNAKFYVGSTVDVHARWRTHRRKLRTGAHHSPHLQAAWNKYGEDAFVFRVVEVAPSFFELAAVEQKWLDEHHGAGRCYNFARHVDSPMRGIKRPAEHGQAISAALKDYYSQNEHPMKGVPRTEETKALIRERRSGKPVSDLTKDLIRQARLGTKASAETREKLSRVRKGRVKAPEHLAKYNKAVLEVTTGVEYPSLKAVKEAFDMSPGALAKALTADRPITKGRNKGKHFKYVDHPPIDMP